MKNNRDYDDGDPRPKASGIPSGTRKGRELGVKGIEGMGMNPKSSHENYSGTRSGRKLGTNTTGPGVTSLGAGVSHLKAHHSARHHMVGKHRMG